MIVGLFRIGIDIRNIGVLYVGFYFMDCMCGGTDASLSKHPIMGIGNPT